MIYAIIVLAGLIVIQWIGYRKAIKDLEDRIDSATDQVWKMNEEIKRIKEIKTIGEYTEDGVLFRNKKGKVVFRSDQVIK